MTAPADNGQTLGSKRYAPLLYFIVGQVGWFACVLSAAHQVPWIGAIVALALVGAHLLCAARPHQELKFIVTATVTGAMWESGLVFFGLLAYPSGTVIPRFAPYWIVTVWALFAAQFNTTFAWLKPRMLVAALLGALAGPLSFRAGAALGALQFVKPLPAALALALGWGVLLPVLVLLSRRFDGVRTAE